MIELVGLLFPFVIGEPWRTIDNYAVKIFVEAHRPEDSGPGKVLATASGYYDGDAFADKLVVYTYERGPGQPHEPRGLFAVGFLTDGFERTDLLFIPESEIVPSSLREYSHDGTSLEIRGKKRLPSDAECCPSADVTIILAVKNGEVVIL